MKLAGAIHPAVRGVVEPLEISLLPELSAQVCVSPNDRLWRSVWRLTTIGRTGGCDEARIHDNVSRGPIQNLRLGEMTRNLAVLGLAERRDPTTRTLDPDVWLRRCAALWALGRTVDAFDIALIGFAVGVWFASGWLSLLGLMALAVVWWRRRRALGERAVSPLYRPIGVLVALAILAVLPSADLEVSLTRLLGLGLGVVLYLRMFDLLDNEKRLWILVSGLAMVGVLVALVGLVGTDWRLDGAPALRAVKEHLPRLITFLPRSEAGGLNPNKLAAALAMLLPLPTAVMLFTPGRFLRLGWGTGAALIGIALVLTESASGLLAGAGALTALAGMRSRMAQRVLPLLGIVVLGVVWWIGPGSIAEAWLGLSLAPEEPPSLDARFKVWSVALSLISSGPLLGIGIGSFPEAVAEHAGWLVANGQPEIPHAHNLYMQVALDIGLPG